MKSRLSLLALSICVVLVGITTLVITSSSGSKRLATPTAPNQPSPTTTENPEVMGASSTEGTTDFDIYKLYLLINAYRKEHAISPLLINPNLEASAQMKLDDMISKKYYRHQDTDGSPSWYLFKKSHYEYTRAGENLSFGIDSPWQVFDGWKESAQHDEQLLIPEYTDMGMAADCATFVEYPDGGCIVVLHLGAQ